MRRITRTAWFGPKRFVGWGWTPTNAWGWFVTLAGIALILPSAFLLHGIAAAVAIVATVALLILVAALTGDPPGGRGLRRDVPRSDG